MSSFLSGYESHKTSRPEEEALCLGPRPFQQPCSMHNWEDRERENDDTVSTWRGKWEEFTAPEHRAQEREKPSFKPQHFLLLGGVEKPFPN